MSNSLGMPKTAIEDLIALLWLEGFKVLGPVACDRGVAFSEVYSAGDMPVGMRDAQDRGAIGSGRGPQAKYLG